MKGGVDALSLHFRKRTYLRLISGKHVDNQCSDHHLLDMCLRVQSAREHPTHVARWCIMFDIALQWASQIHSTDFGHRSLLCIADVGAHFL